MNEKIANCEHCLCGESEEKSKYPHLKCCMCGVTTNELARAYKNLEKFEEKAEAFDYIARIKGYDVMTTKGAKDSLFELITKL